jgi:hypothetical protein
MALIKEGHTFQGKSNKVNEKLDKVKRWHIGEVALPWR